jgi:ferritin
MLTKKVEDILNLQIEKEGYSSNLYLAMATWSEANGFAGVANWMYVQADEERMHMLKIVKYIAERGGNAIIPAFKEPPKNQKAIQEMFEAVMQHEEYISASINEIVALAISEKDFTTQSWVQWFVNEQIEEEAQVAAILDKLKLLGEHNMYLFDRDIMSLRGGEGDE